MFTVRGGDGPAKRRIAIGDSHGHVVSFDHNGTLIHNLTLPQPDGGSAHAVTHATEIKRSSSQLAVATHTGVTFLSATKFTLSKQRCAVSNTFCCVP